MNKELRLLNLYKDLKKLRLTKQEIETKMKFVEEEIKDIIYERKIRRTRISIEQKRKAISLIEEGLVMPEVSKQIGISLASLRNNWKKWKQQIGMVK